MEKVRVILNGKGAGNPEVRAAINRIRNEGQPVGVRCTWEGGDAARFAREAVADRVDRLVAGGGDGTIHEVVNGLMAEGGPGDLALGMLPLGTANRFVHYRQRSSFDIEVDSELPINLDGEPYRWDRIHFEVRPRALRVVLPEDCPLILAR